MQQRRVAELSAGDAQELLSADSIMILPCGSMEQHGDHLPLGSDTTIADRIAEEVVSAVGEGIDAWLLPSLSYGKSNEHAWRPGTVALSAATFGALLDDIGKAVAATPARKLVFLNGHGGNYASLPIACKDIRERHGLMTFLVFPDLPEGFVIPGGHPDQGLAAHSGHEETSIMLHLAADQVDMTRAVRAVPEQLREYSHLRFGGAVQFGWTSDDFGPTGVIGDATEANPEAGAAIFEAMMARTVEQLEEIARFSLPLSDPGRD